MAKYATFMSRIKYRHTKIVASAGSPRIVGEFLKLIADYYLPAQIYVVMRG